MAPHLHCLFISLSWSHTKPTKIILPIFPLPFMDKVISYLQKYFYVFSILLLFMCDTNTNQQSEPNKTKCSPVFVKRKQIMVCFMAFSCKTGSISRCLKLDVSAPAPGGFTWLQAQSSLQLKIISPTTYSSSSSSIKFVTFQYCGLLGARNNFYN